MLVAALAADLDAKPPTSYSVTLVLPDGSRHWDYRSRIHLHIRGPIDTADEEEVGASLSGELTFHRPHGRLAVERHVVVNDPTSVNRDPQPEPRLIGEGVYTEWVDRSGDVIRQSGYSARMMAGSGTYGAGYQHLAPRRTIDG